DPVYAVAQANLAAAYYFKGQYDLAVEHCDKAIGLGYSVNTEFLKALKEHRK
ncbi:unnamed protein product, partial [marine sediment metagenome]